MRKQNQRKQIPYANRDVQAEQIEGYLEQLERITPDDIRRSSPTFPGCFLKRLAVETLDRDGPEYRDVSDRYRTMGKYFQKGLAGHDTTRGLCLLAGGTQFLKAVAEGTSPKHVDRIDISFKFRDTGEGKRFYFKRSGDNRHHMDAKSLREVDDNDQPVDRDVNEFSNLVLIGTAGQPNEHHLLHGAILLPQVNFGPGVIVPHEAVHPAFPIYPPIRLRSGLETAEYDGDIAWDTDPDYDTKKSGDMKVFDKPAKRAFQTVDEVYDHLKLQAKKLLHVAESSEKHGAFPAQIVEYARRTAEDPRATFPEAWAERIVAYSEVCGHRAYKIPAEYAQYSEAYAAIYSRTDRRSEEARRDAAAELGAKVAPRHLPAGAVIGKEAGGAPVYLPDGHVPSDPIPLLDEDGFVMQETLHLPPGQDEAEEIDEITTLSC